MGFDGICDTLLNCFGYYTGLAVTSVCPYVGQSLEREIRNGLESLVRQRLARAWTAEASPLTHFGDLLVPSFVWDCLLRHLYGYLSCPSVTCCSSNENNFLTENFVFSAKRAWTCIIVFPLPEIERSYINWWLSWTLLGSGVAF